MNIKALPKNMCSRSIGNMKALLEFLKYQNFHPKSILDVGANKGNWCRIIKSVFPNARCFMIEPQIEMKPYLENFCKEFPDSKYILAGVSPFNGEMTLNLWEDLEGSSFLIPKELKDKKQRKVKVVTINELIDKKSIDMPQLVKMDIQGYELEALKGAKKLFGKTEVFIIEASFFEFLPEQPIFHEVIDFMIKKGYVVYDFAGFIRRPYDGALANIDICFVKENGFLRSSNKW